MNETEKLILEELKKFQTVTHTTPVIYQKDFPAVAKWIHKMLLAVPDELKRRKLEREEVELKSETDVLRAMGLDVAPTDKEQKPNGSYYIPCPNCQEMVHQRSTFCDACLKAIK